MVGICVRIFFSDFLCFFGIRTFLGPQDGEHTCVPTHHCVVTTTHTKRKMCVLFIFLPFRAYGFVPTTHTHTKRSHIVHVCATHASIWRTNGGFHLFIKRPMCSRWSGMIFPYCARHKATSEIPPTYAPGHWLGTQHKKNRPSHDNDTGR